MPYSSQSSVALPTPQAFVVVESFPALFRQVETSLAAQHARVRERMAGFIERPELVAALDSRIAAVQGGLVLLEAEPGAGATSLLCHLAVTRAYPLWLPDDDAGGGVEALCAQLLALYDLPLPLVPPAAARDATTLEALLQEAAARRTSPEPLVVLIGRASYERPTPLPLPFPAAVPPGVLIVHACSRAESRQLPAAGRVVLPTRSRRLQRLVAQLATRAGCAELAERIVRHSLGSPLYARLACGLLQTGPLQRGGLPHGVDALLDTAWNALDQRGRRLLQTLAAVAEPLPLPLLAEAAGVLQADVHRFIRQWDVLIEGDRQQVALYHPRVRAFVARRSGAELAAAHGTFVALAQQRAGRNLEQLNAYDDGYLVRQLARHVSLSTPDIAAELTPVLASRAWVLAQERRTGTHAAAARDAAWLLRRIAADGPLPQLVRLAALAGTLALLGRTLPAEGLVEAFSTTIDRGDNREATLRRARELVDQLPVGREKALVLRLLGEACYERRMRAQAMRMLSEALDLEVPGLPRAWRDEREETLVAFARVAVTIGAPDLALGITAQIGHAERRGMIETEVVRWLLAHDQRTRAEEVAYAIVHESMHEWAMAEVAVGHARAGDTTRAEEVLSTLKTETAVAWARAELACDHARAGDRQATELILALPNEFLRNRSLALVAQALVAGGRASEAIVAAGQISDRGVRVRALIDLALLRPPNAGAVLARAAADVAAIDEDERTPLAVALATAHASNGDIGLALEVAATLPEGEERDRAQSRVVVALARQGDHRAARRIARAIPDDDERDWTYHELAQLEAEAQRWEEALALVRMIVDAEERARAMADVCVVRARAGAAAETQASIAAIDVPAERGRAAIATVEPLVSQGAAPLARRILARLSEPEVHSRYATALALALVAHAEPDGALALVPEIARPLDQARVLVAVAGALAASDRQAALQALGRALRITAALGRTEVFACLTWAAEPLVALGNSDLLLAAAHALDEIDGWWEV